MSSWSDQEVEVAVRDYFDMLEAELRGEDYNKAEHNRILRESLEGRTKGSVERKHQNISAILLELELPYIDGYKPLGNYQGVLRDAVRVHLQKHGSVLDRMHAMAERQEYHEQPVPSLWDVLVDPPKQEREAETGPDTESRRIARKYDFPQQDARNRRLGKLGEMFVLNFEKAMLTDKGMGKLADRVRWVSEDEGDGLGYDILSYSDVGEPKFIEVKTTNYGRSFPFIVSRNELKVSEEFSNQYSLYRVFAYSRQPRLFMLPGAISGHCKLDAQSYRASFGRVA